MTYQQQMRRLLDKFCGCGTDEGKWGMLLELLERAATRQVSFYEPIGDIPPRAVEFMAHVLDHWGMTEHSFSIGYTQLTEDGEKVLAWLREHGTYDDQWPDWWCSCQAGEEW